MAEESSELAGINLIIELAKELLYSGIPEQVIDLYSLYHESLMQYGKYHFKDHIDSAAPPLIPNSTMITLVIRALIQLGDVRFRI
jgi:hypothetical protein